MKIGILGGTFDPIHIAHINMALEAYKQLELDKIWFMPSFKPPHKSNSITSYQDRLYMLRLALQEYSFFEVCELEAKRKENSYTKVSLSILKEEYPEYEFFFIMGADSFFELETWFEYKSIFSLASLIIINRNYNLEHKDLNFLKAKYETDYGAKIYIIEFDKVISSSKIRVDIANNNLDIGLLDSKVWEYIKNKKLYGYDDGR